MDIENKLEQIDLVINPRESQSRLLIVEDTAIQAKKLKFYLEKIGYEVVWALNGKEALNELENKHFDLVITDVQMPEMNGFEMLEKIRSNSKLKKIPVVVITTLDTDEACEESLLLGAEDFIAKPFRPREINIRISNILERKHSEELARLQLQAIESSMDGMAILTSQGEFVYANEAQVKVFGYYGSNEMVGDNWETLYPEEEIKRLRENILPEFGEKGKWIGEIWAKRKDGTSYLQEMSLTKMEDGKFISICRDITKRKAQEKEREELEKKVYIASRLASVGGLAAGVAHEINNPVTILVGYFKKLEKLVMDGAKDRDKCISSLEKLETTLNRINKIISNLKVYSKVDSASEIEKIDAHKSIKNSVEMISLSYSEQNTNIELNFNAKNVFVDGDNGKFGQVIVNILSNAKDAMSTKGGGVIKVDTSNLNNTIEIRFSDTGYGIAKENLDKIFDAFFTTKTIGSGTGLGLSVAYSVIDEMKGNIEVISEVGVGSTFIIKLPLSV
ncbi:MAG: response regulator [Oligoflexia bacterium]|nr:response regulator [Oligoflexia bacterium]